MHHIISSYGFPAVKLNRMNNSKEWNLLFNAFNENSDETLKIVL